MNASWCGLAAAILLTLSSAQSATAGGVAIVRPGGWAHADHMRRGPEFVRDDHRFFRDRDDRFGDRNDRFRGDRFVDRDDRFRHERRDFGGGWGGYYGGPNYESPVAEAAPAEILAGPSLDITINISPPAPASGTQSARAYARPIGPRVITIGASTQATNLEKLPIIIYGRQPVGEND
jgi:hypothetical protein